MKQIPAANPEFFAVTTTNEKGDLVFIRTHKSVYRGVKRIWLNEDYMPRHSGCTNDEKKLHKMLDAAVEGNQQTVYDYQESADRHAQSGGAPTWHQEAADKYRARKFTAVRIRIEPI